jgi:hypothetical protein
VDDLVPQEGYSVSTRRSLLTLVARDLGWPTGSVSSGGADNAVLGNHIGSYGDDAALVGWTLLLPDAATAADQERTIESWDDSEGQAFFVRARTDVTYSSESYILVPPGDYTRQDIYTALNDCLSHTRWTSPFVLPTVQDETLYRLGRLSWLRSREDVDAVFYRASPNILTNSQFDIWGAGTSAAPTGWTLTATAARATSGAGRGYYAVQLGGEGALTQDAGRANGQLLGKTISAACYVRNSTASASRIGISDGLTATYSSYHTGGGGDELLTVSKTISSSAISLLIGPDCSSSNVTATFSNCVAVEGSSVPAPLTGTGDNAYRLQELPGAKVRQVGDQQAVELVRSMGRGGQIVVYSSQLYPQLSADTSSTLLPDDVAVPGTIYELTSRMQKGQDRTRIELLMGRSHREYVALSRPLREYPVLPTRHQYMLVGA